MNKDTKLKLQTFSSIGFATLIILVASVFFFNRLSQLLQHNEAIIAHTEEQIFEANELEPLLYKVLQHKADQIEGQQGDQTAEFQTTLDKVEETLATLKKISSEELDRFPIIPESFQKLETSVNDIISFSVDNTDEQLLFKEQTTLQFNLRTQVHQFIDSFLASRETLVSANKKSIQTSKDITIIAISLALFIFLYTFIKIYQTSIFLRRSSAEVRRVNADYLKVTEKMEMTNWSLETNALIIERLSGINEEEKISEIVLGAFKEAIPVAAAAIYVRPFATDTYIRRAHTGIEADQSTKSFIEGEGYLGKIVQDKLPVLLSSEQYPAIRAKTAVLESIPIRVFLYPLVHYGSCVGLIELAVHDDSTPNEKYETFLTRASRNIALSIKIGQDHLLVEKLLEETQQQTEEMEAQQEELRITNEELIHKTNLLEASEEELRVQQEELSQANFELNQKAVELVDKNIELNEAQQIVEQKIIEIEQASRYKSEFMANMSHELRTPLNSILILAKLLNDNKGKNLTTDQVKYASVIHSAGTDLLSLINELLDLAKIEAGKVDLNVDNIEITHFIKEIEELFSEIAKDKGIEFDIQIEATAPKTMISDEYRVQQVLKNFLSNAFKFTDRGGKVSVFVREKNNELSFEVTDTGKGISKEKQALIFDAFRQEDGSTSRKYGGTGLGLSISREIAFLLRGRIELQSELDKGSSFTLILPIETPAEDAPKAEISALPIIRETLPVPPAQPIQQPDTHTLQPMDENSGKQQILIIEDDINFASILKGFAEDYGFEVRLAHDGALGIKLAEDHLPDAIILDVMLPISDGWEVLNTLKENPKTKHIPIHMMSAATYDKKDLLEKGAIGFMQKPVNEDAIQRTFENINLTLNNSIKNILLIEDQELQSDLIKNAFSEQGINVIQAFTIETGLKKIHEEPNIDCIILDLRLPDGSGLELIERIKGDPNLNETPIIINTAAEISAEDHDKILSYAKATVLKTDKSNNRLIDEVNLFLNKINDQNYSPLRSPQKIDARNRDQSLKGKTVLIADDDMRNVFALSTSLQALDMNIEIANNGAEAVKIIEEKGDNIDIVLMDIMMPEMDGHEAIEKIRSNLRYRNLPILAVTAKAMKGDREKSLQVGANDYVSKPIDMSKLISLMQVWLS